MTTIDDDIIKTDIEKLTININNKNLAIRELNVLRGTLMSLQKTTSRVSNAKGGYDVVTTTPNEHSLSAADLSKTRQIYYDNAIKKFAKLGL